MADDNSTQNNDAANNSAKKYTAQEVIDKDIFEILGLSNSDSDTKQKMMDEMTATVKTRVISRVDDLISDDQVDEWKEIVESGDKQAYAKFLTEHEINLDKLFAEESISYKMEMAALTNVLKEEE